MSDLHYLRELVLDYSILVANTRRKKKKLALLLEAQQTLLEYIDDELVSKEFHKMQRDVV